MIFESLSGLAQSKNIPIKFIAGVGGGPRKAPATGWDNNLFFNTSNGALKASQIVKYSFDGVVCYNDMKMSSLRQNSFYRTNADMNPTAPTFSNDTFTTDGAFTYINYAKKNNMIMRGHTLCWYSQIPKFVSDMETNGYPLNSSNVQTILENHIKKTMDIMYNKPNDFSHIVCWDVVNEMSHPTDNSRSVWYKYLGKNTLNIAFNTAYNALPLNLRGKVKLFYNDYNIENNIGSVIYMLSTVPHVHGVGFQCHLSSSFKAEATQKAIHRIRQEGYIVHITELDVGTGNPSRKIQIYRELLSIALDEGVEFFCLWDLGTTDSGKGPFDDKLQPNASYTAMIDVLKNYNSSNYNKNNPGIPVRGNKT